MAQARGATWRPPRQQPRAPAGPRNAAAGDARDFLPELERRVLGSDGRSGVGQEGRGPDVIREPARGGVRRLGSNREQRHRDGRGGEPPHDSGRVCGNGKPVPVQNADWQRFVQGLRERGMATYKAGQSKNMDMVVDAADKVTTACMNCHEVYREKTPAQGGMAARCTK
jgi:hypothetical protein